ncbi:malate dehydrogenase [Pyrrhoderma noxium]|uniref:Malate dehydrogenase n=1 Tax=Pyrrhoderma noxium TaxID=2282107 RepID=A0A286UJW2_9AGAM|nr:malate dehydrogenase [Pyrrhoderma noxium]
MVSFPTIVTLALSASIAFALPRRSTTCNIPKTKPSLPSNETSICIPDGQSVHTVALGVGYQNYTCSSAGTYSSIGAVAELVDITHLSKLGECSDITATTYDAWNSTSTTPEEFVKHLRRYPVLAQHYFIKNPSGSGLSPFFDARSVTGNPDKYAMVSKSGDVPAPSGSQDVDWLQLTAVQGELAKTIMRLETKYGQPQPSCVPGSEDISVKYTAQYYFLD